MQDKTSAAFALPDTSKVGPFCPEMVKLSWIKHSKYYKGNDKLKGNQKLFHTKFIMGLTRHIIFY